MLFDFEENVEVARGAAVRSRLALVRHAQARAGIDSRRDVHFMGAIALDAALAAARLASFLDDLSGAAASGTSARNGEKSLLVAHLPAAAAGATGGHATSGLGAGAVAGFAKLIACDSNPSTNAGGGLVEGQGHVVTQIGAALAARAAPAAASSCCAAENLIEAEEIAEDILKLLEDSGVESGGIEAAIGKAGMAEAVVDRPLLGIGENAVGLGGLAEFVFSFGLGFGIAVRMILERSLPVGGLDLVAGGVALDAENFVIIDAGLRAFVPFPYELFQLFLSIVSAPRETRPTWLPGAVATRTIAGLTTRSWNRYPGCNSRPRSPPSAPGRLDAADRMVEVRVEFLAHGIDAHQALLGERIPELAAHQLKSFAIFGAGAISGRRLRGRAIEGIEHGNQLFDEQLQRRGAAPGGVLFRRACGNCRNQPGDEGAYSSTPAFRPGACRIRIERIGRSELLPGQLTFCSAVF